jgi:hypothetical protein
MLRPSDDLTGDDVRSLTLGFVMTLALTSSTVAQDGQVDGIKDGLGYTTLEEKVIIPDTIAPTTKEWVTVEKNADISTIKKVLSDAGWSEEYVAKSLPGIGKYDLLQTAAAPGQVTYMAVPQSGAVGAQPVQFGVLGFGSLFGDKVENVSFEKVRDDAIARLRSAVAAACAMPGRPSSLTIKVSIEVLEIEATWEADDVCGGGTANP